MPELSDAHFVYSDKLASAELVGAALLRGIRHINLLCKSDQFEASLKQLEKVTKKAKDYGIEIWSGRYLSISSEADLAKVEKKPVYTLGFVELNCKQLLDTGLSAEGLMLSHTELCCKLIGSKTIDALVWPDLPERFVDIPDQLRFDCYEKLASCLEEQRVLLEVCSDGLRRQVDASSTKLRPQAQGFSPNPELLAHLRERKIGLVAGSAARCADELGVGIRDAYALIRASGWTELILPKASKSDLELVSLVD